MANASKHHMNHDGQGKGSGSGGMTDLQEDLVGENQVLSNRDKAQHSDTRGLDSKAIQSEQAQDLDSNQGRESD